MMRMRYGHRAQARILVADCDKVHALALSAIMRKMGFDVATASSGEEAVTVAATFVPDLVVLEVLMRGLPGIQAAVQITAALPECRVLFLSADASIFDILNAAPENLVYSFTTKPVHPLDLLNSIAYMLSAEWSSDDSDDVHTNRGTIGSRSAKRIAAETGLDARGGAAALFAG